MPASVVRTRSRVATPPKPTPAPAPKEAAITRMLAQPAPAAHPDEALLALGRRFDELHAAWMVTVEADREPTERFKAHLEAAKARGGATVKDHEAAWALPGVMASHDREFEAFGKLDPLFKAIVAMPAETVDGLAVKARALVAGSWPNGNYSQDRHLGSDEDWPLDLIRNLIESTCRLASVDWQGKPVGTAPFELPKQLTVPVIEVDPIFAAIQARAAACAAFDAWEEARGRRQLTTAQRAEEDTLSAASLAAYRRMLSTVPTTAAGRLALLERLQVEMDLHGMANGDPPEAESPFWEEFFGALRGALGASSEPSLADHIIAGWREWGARPDFDESPEADRLSDQRNALLDAAEALPATPENILPKALASAWLEYVALWSSGQARQQYGADGRLALDIDTAICGRLKTHYVRAGG